MLPRRPEIEPLAEGVSFELSTRVQVPFDEHASFSNHGGPEPRRGAIDLTHVELRTAGHGTPLQLRGPALDDRVREELRRDERDVEIARRLAPCRGAVQVRHDDAIIEDLAGEPSELAERVFGDGTPFKLGIAGHDTECSARDAASQGFAPHPDILRCTDRWTGQ